ncbi:sigma factor-like helix-turn-helix DNA-binding protein [Staphylococcus pasteuri]|uniref:sigma factor-like helix-turn-helix DNA-binding protein n=1 Tax=Staphylococcus pasteuri TaxID=45972 RepID=UPI001E493F63|nr:sigma factor-like helix-turn-helix DNA-binding protein [Staphylococcus pasteuri]MCE3022725.1 RNA polymerase subunit sigma-70 [Staphylococcus pasteuri]
MINLLNEYRKTKNAILKKIKQYENKDNDKLKCYQESLKDIIYVIEWLTKGHEPNNYKAIDKRQCYLISPETIEKMVDESMYKKVYGDDYKVIMNNINKPFNKILYKLTDRELECFIMVKSEGITYKKCADFLGLSTGTVQKYIERARVKIEKNLKEMNFHNG